MLDIDHFKRINDTYGHAVGDQALKVLCELCRSNLRDIEIFGRLGGEEFGILLPDKTLEIGKQIAERIRYVIEANVITLDEKQVSFTVSLGLCELQAEQSNFEALIKCTDIALYKAKEKGRNQIQLA